MAERKGDAAVPELASALNTSENAIFNLARELRLLGVTAYEPNRVRLTEDLWNSEDREKAVRRRVATALRRHRAFSALVRLAERGDGAVPSGDYARELPGTFPAVSVASNTWLVYARAFILWFEYAGLVTTAGQIALVCAEGEEPATTHMFGFRAPVRTKGAFPQRPPGPSVALLLRIAAGEQIRGNEFRRQEAETLRELILLGAVAFDPQGLVELIRPELIYGGKIDTTCLRELIVAQKGCREALALIDEDGAASPASVGEVVGNAYRAEWSPGTAHSVGKHLRAWGTPCRD